jgi:arabinofuranan 3-O-arabinosyltransferase
MRPDRLRLDGPAPTPLATAATAPPRVFDPGEGDETSRDGVRLRLSGPSWLVLGQSFSDGWRAWCRDARGRERPLGEPIPADGFANAWPVGRWCREARFEFEPQKLATASYVASAAGGALMLLIVGASLLLGRRRHIGKRAARGEAARSGGAAAPATSAERASASGAADPTAVPAGLVGDRSAPDPVRRLSWRASLAAGAVMAVAGGFMFALRAGAVLGPLTVLFLRAGVSVRRLLAVATGGLALLPVLYIAFPPRDEGGFAPDYALDSLAAHWVAVGVVVSLGGAASLWAWRLRAARLAAGPVRPPSGPGGHSSRSEAPARAGSAR